LGALGCGAFRNPPQHIACLFRNVLKESEFQGVFNHIVFAVLDIAKTSNFKIFNDVLGNGIINFEIPQDDGHARKLKKERKRQERKERRTKQPIAELESSEPWQTYDLFEELSLQEGA